MSERETNPDADAFDAFLRRTQEATHRTIRDVIEIDATVRMRDEDFEEAIAGYRLLGDQASVLLLQRAQALADDPVALEALTAEVSGGPWHGVPWADAARVVYVREHREEFLG